MKLLVIIPAYNEEDNITGVVQELIDNYAQFDYVVINDCGQDKTAEICREMGYNMVNLPANLGLAGAFQTGMRYARKYGYDCAVQLDGDGQHCAEYIATMAQTLEEGYDIVIGSRYVTEKKPYTLRMLGGRLISFAIFITTGKRIKDPTSGMRIYNKAMINEFAYGLNHTPEPDTISYLLRRGLRLAEVQVQMRERTSGQSYLTHMRSISYMLHMIVSILLIQWCRGGKAIAREKQTAQEREHCV